MTTTPNDVPTGQQHTSVSGQTTTDTTDNSQQNQQHSNIQMSSVAEIFHAAGFAFKKLSELIQSMDPTYCDTNHKEPGFQTHWDQADVDQFSTIVNNFTDDLNQLSENLKTKMANRLKEEHNDAKMKTLTSKEQEMIKE